MKKLLIPILMVLMLASGCFYMNGSPIGGTQIPTITSFNSSPSSISPGEPATLTWEVSGAISVTIDQGVGNVAITGTRAVVPAVTTVYTLTATSAGGTASATTQVVVAGMPSPTPTPTPYPTPTPTPSPTGYPVVNYFTASPASISSGGSATLGWSVSNAASVVIDQGIGVVGLTGTAPVSPATSTMYTLIATNAIGSYFATANVFVGAAPPPAGKPDLVITDVSKSGNTITYTIKNQGTVSTGESTTSRLRIDGVTKSYDPVLSLTAGASRNESFTTYTYACSGVSDSVEVHADVYNNIEESDETNNAKSVTMSCVIAIIPGPVLSPGVLTIKPDLVVTDIWRSSGKVYYKIKNQGIAKAEPAFKCKLYIDGAYKATDDVSYVNAGSEITQQFSTYSWMLCVVGPHNVKVIADSTGVVPETNDTNNELAKTINCP